MEDIINYNILRLGESLSGRLVAEEICPLTGDCLKRTFFAPPRLFAKEKKTAVDFTHRILPSSAFRWSIF